MPQAFLWASGITDQTCGEPHRREKALHHRKHHPWDWNLDMGTLFKGRIYGAVVMRKCYVALKEFCLENQLKQVHIHQLYLPFQLCNNTNLMNEPFHAGFLVFTSSGAEHPSMPMSTHTHGSHLPASGDFIFPLSGVLAEGSVPSPRQGLFLIRVSMGPNVLQIFTVR